MTCETTGAALLDAKTRREYLKAVWHYDDMAIDRLFALEHALGGPVSVGPTANSYGYTVSVSLETSGKACALRTLAQTLGVDPYDHTQTNDNE